MVKDNQRYIGVKVSKKLVQRFEQLAATFEDEEGSKMTKTRAVKLGLSRAIKLMELANEQ